MTLSMRANYSNLRSNTKSEDSSGKMPHFRRDKLGQTYARY
jgi:hypothetical protein